MQTSRIIRALALALFFLFPLLSVVQLRDTDAPWRRMASRLRPAVVRLVDARGAEVGCGLVLQGRPLRLVTVGVPPAGVVSTLAEGDIAWTPLLVDDKERFTILQAQDGPAAQAVMTSLGQAMAAAGAPTPTLLDLEGTMMRPGGVKAALVGPGTFEGESLWVGVLQPAASTPGDPLYRASLLRRVDAVARVPTAEAWAVGGEQIDTRLRGAPFADAQGRIVGLYRTRQAHHEDVLPIHVVTRALVFVHLQAAQ